MTDWGHRALPILEWLPDYRLAHARWDLRAGLTVGVMLIPQGMAYAVLAGVPPIYGLYASVAPLLIYPIFGSSRHLAVGVNAAILIIVAAGLTPLAEPGSPEYVGLAVAVAALVGLVQVAMGFARMGFLANLLSRPVIAGFTAAAALIILVSQAGNFLGLELPRSQFVGVVASETYQRLDQVSYFSTLLGAGCLLALVSLRRSKPLFPSELTVLLAATAMAWGFDLGEAGVPLLGQVPSGLPGLALPELSFSMVQELWPTVVALALVIFMSTVSLGRVFSVRYRYSIEPNRELVAVGAANLLGSFFRGIPVAGSFSRTAVNEQAGARSSLSNVVAAGVIALTLLFFTPLFRYLPMPALAAIIIVAAVGLVDVKEIRRLWRTKPSDGLVALITFFSVLGVGIAEGVLIGVAAAVIKILYRLSRPYVAELGHLPATRDFRNLDRFREAEIIPGILLLRVEAGFSFFNAKFFRDYVLEKSQEEDRHVRSVILDGVSINYLDSTAVEAIEEVVGTLRTWDIEMHFTGLTGPVRDVVERSGLGDFVGEDHFHISPHYAVIDILDRWDDEDRGARLEHYWRSTRKVREEVEPTSETRFI